MGVVMILFLNVVLEEDELKTSLVLISSISSVLVIVVAPPLTLLADMFVLLGYQEC